MNWRDVATNLGRLAIIAMIWFVIGSTFIHVVLWLGG